MEPLRARVFISCGQRTETEREIAKTIADILEKLGYDPYVAVQEQTLRGLKENIFAQLSNSEYFLFIDFAREQLQDKARGSLFSHQELAIASYLDLPVIAFQQTSVALEGVLSFSQVNPRGFSSIEELPDKVVSEVKSRWSPVWKNKLYIERDDKEFDDALVPQEFSIRGRKARFFHLRVKNMHKFKTAVGCRAYIKQLAALGIGNRSNEEILDSLQGRPVELKWAGYPFPDVMIPPGYSRDLDAGLVFHDRPDTWFASSLSDSGFYQSSMRGPGTFVVMFEVVSENFPAATLSVRVTLGSIIDQAQVEAVLTPT